MRRLGPTLAACLAAATVAAAQPPVPAPAPITIIEYASMTCPHCAHFSANLSHANFGSPSNRTARTCSRQMAMRPRCFVL